MYLITDDEINKLSESSKNDFYRILAELNPSINLQYTYTNPQDYGQQGVRRCGDTWMYCDGICTKCGRYLSGTSERTTVNPY